MSTQLLPMELMTVQRRTYAIPRRPSRLAVRPPLTFGGYTIHISVYANRSLVPRGYTAINRMRDEPSIREIDVGAAT
jgi:hypothetical protein